MKNYLALLLFTFCTLNLTGQCSSVGISISSSDTSYVQLYHAGFFNIPSGFANTCGWEITSFTGELIHEEITSGAFEDQSFMLFNHDVPLTDSMRVSLVITNDTAGIICTILDTLFWSETEVIPGSFIGNWEVLSNNVGIEEGIISSLYSFTDEDNIKVFPSPTNNSFYVKGDRNTYSFSIVNLSGQTLSTYVNIDSQETIDVSYLSSGVYLINFENTKNRYLSSQKLIINH